jgi:hypothetical protein
VKNLIRKILREDKDWDFISDSTPSAVETMNTVLGYEKEGDKYKAVKDIIYDGRVTLWFYEFDSRLGEYNPLTYLKLEKEEYQIDELLDFVVEKMEFMIHNNHAIAKEGGLGPRTIGMLKIRKKEELLNTIKNVRTNTLKEDKDWDWAKEVPTIEGRFTVTFCDMVLLDDNGKTITEVMKIVEENFGKVFPTGFGSDRIADTLISQEDGREVVIYIDPYGKFFGDDVSGDDACHVGWDTCYTHQKNQGFMGKDVYTHQEFIKMFG